MASWSTYLNVIGFIALLFFFVPIKIKGPTELEEKFVEYLKQFNKTYTNETEYSMRLEVFSKSLNEIDKLNSHPNKTNKSAIYGLTKFSDLLPHEFLQPNLNLKQLRLGVDFKTSSRRRGHRRSVLSWWRNVPGKVDWRAKNAVTRVRNQEHCGACWAFSAIETIESMYAIKTGDLVDLSVQEMIDCAGNNNNGCSGGDICDLLFWLLDNSVKILMEADYPLELSNNRCRANSTSTGLVQVEKFDCENLIGSEDTILKLLALNGPVAVAINAKTWQNYVGGVIQYHCEDNWDQLNHAVQIVGYDLTAEIPHYIVRNTWGEDFGDQGYLYIAIGQNLCGLANQVTALTV